MNLEFLTMPLRRYWFLLPLMAFLFQECLIIEKFLEVITHHQKMLPSDMLLLIQVGALATNMFFLGVRDWLASTTVLHQRHATPAMVLVAGVSRGDMSDWISR